MAVTAAETTATATDAPAAHGAKAPEARPESRRYVSLDAFRGFIMVILFMVIGFYGIVEVLGYRKWTFPLIVVGMNSIFIYFVSEVLFRWLDRAVGVFTFIGLLILSATVDPIFGRYAILLSVTAGILELVPIIGPIISAMTLSENSPRCSPMT